MSYSISACKSVSAQRLWCLCADRVFSSSETTDQLYQDIAKPLVVSAVEGYNGTTRRFALVLQWAETQAAYGHVLMTLLMHRSPGTIFAYGQTSSGKTFTMMGSDLVPGVIPLSMEEVFQTIQKVRRRFLNLRIGRYRVYTDTASSIDTTDSTFSSY